MSDNTIVEQGQYLCFCAAGEEYAVSVVRVREIIEYKPLTKVPASARAIRGVVNLRGRVVPVLDLAMRFRLPEMSITKRTCIVMIEAGAAKDEVVGLLADSVSQVIDLAADKIQPPPAICTRTGSEYLLGMAELGNKFALLLDVDTLLAEIDIDDIGEIDATEAEQADAGEVVPVVVPAAAPQPALAGPPSAPRALG